MAIELLLACVILFAAGISCAAAESPCVQVDGKPFFVIGCYDYPGGGDLEPAHLKEMAESGINAIHVQLHNLPPAKDFTLKDLDNAHKLGVKVIPSLNTVPPWNKEDTAKNWGSQPEQFKPGSDLHKRISQIKDHPALLMYETMDEPAGCFEMLNRPTWPSLRIVQACYDFVKSVDPKHPVWCNEVAWYWCKDHLSFERFRAWSKPCDVYSQDDYPVGGPAYPNSPLWVLADDVDWMMKIVDEDGVEPWIPAKPVLMVLQGQGRNMCALDRPEIHQRNPNKIETRYVAYASIVHGAKGILWWGTHDLAPIKDSDGLPTPNGEFWEVVKSVSREIAALKDVFLTPRVWSGCNFTDKRLDAALWRHDGTNYLVVTNRSHETVLETQITADGWRSPDKKVRVLFEQRRLDVDNSTWHDSFGPWDVHVYTDSQSEH